MLVKSPADIKYIFSDELTALHLDGDILFGLLKKVKNKVFYQKLI